MKLPYLNNREQLLSALTISVLLLGGYAGLRYVPAHKLIADLNQSADATEKRLATTTIPEEPDEDIDDLDDQLQAQQRATAELNSQAAQLQRRLAPLDSREMIVDISQLARNSQVRIRINESFNASSVLPAAEPPKPKAAKKKKSKSQAKPKPSAKTTASEIEAAVLPASAGWIKRMSPGTVFERPMQRLQLEGSYQALSQFVYGLDALPFQVTVLRLTIEKMPVLAPRGYAQTLLAEMILAL